MDGNFLKLKDSNGNEIYSIDKIGNKNILISQMKAVIDVFDNYVLCDSNNNVLCDINICEVISNIVLQAIDIKLPNENIHGVSFRKLSESFSDDINLITKANQAKYQPPNDLDILKSLHDSALGVIEEHTDDSKNNLTPQDIYDIAEKDMKENNGVLKSSTFLRIEESIQKLGADPLEYVRMDQAKFIFNLGRWKYKFLESK